MAHSTRGEQGPLTRSGQAPSTHTDHAAAAQPGHSCCGGACDPRAPQPPPSAAPRRKLPSLVVFGGLAIAAGAAAEWAGMSPIAQVAYAVAILLSIPRPAARAWTAVRSRVLDINLLMVIAVAGALALGEWFEAATVVWLFGLAQWLEARSMERARHAIRSLMSLAPEVATVRRSGAFVEVPVAEVAVGDVVLIRPGDRIPTDGLVLTGESAVDQAPITGESWPADKGPGQPVFAGTINGTGALEVEVQRPASDSTLARIIHMVERAQSRRAPVQTFVDRFARVYTPAVVVVAALVAIVPPLVLGGLAGWSSHFGVWSYRALALLVVACPCALVISTPVSIVSALTAAARAGVLIKGGAYLERLGAVRAVAFDKTGTLTRGRIAVTEVVGVGGATSAGVLRVAAALEAGSEHPIGRAIVDHARVAGLVVSPGAAFRALPGLGAEATVGAVPAIVGSHRLFEDRRLCTPALHACAEDVERRGATPVLVGQAGAPLGVIGLADELRAESRAAVASLRSHGVDRVVLLTGDVTRNARSAVHDAGLDEAHAELLPGDKVEALARLRAQHGPVAMVGDGVNDAPALAAADVGIAMGAAGTDVALETADVVLMSDDLARLPFVLRLARRTLTNIRQNVTIALSLKLAFVVLAASGLATMWMAIVADTGASLLVTANSLRLLKGGPQ